MRIGHPWISCSMSHNIHNFRVPTHCLPISPSIQICIWFWMNLYFTLPKWSCRCPAAQTWRLSLIGSWTASSSPPSSGSYGRCRASLSRFTVYRPGEWFPRVGLLSWQLCSWCWIDRSFCVFSAIRWQSQGHSSPAIYPGSLMWRPCSFWFCFWWRASVCRSSFGVCAWRSCILWCRTGMVMPIYSFSFTEILILFIPLKFINLCGES